MIACCKEGLETDADGGLEIRKRRMVNGVEKEE